MKPLFYRFVCADNLTDFFCDSGLTYIVAHEFCCDVFVPHLR